MRGGGTREMDGPTMGKTPGDDRDLVLGRGRKRGVEQTQ